MDLGFSLARARAARPAEHPADAPTLLAAFAAAQAVLPTAAAAARMAAAPRGPQDARRALVALFTESRALGRSVVALGGSFHPRIAAAAAGKAGSTLMKPGFTFAF